MSLDNKMVLYVSFLHFLFNVDILLLIENSRSKLSQNFSFCSSFWLIFLGVFFVIFVGIIVECFQRVRLRKGTFNYGTLFGIFIHFETRTKVNDQ
jgi:hypothetical protein